MGKVQKFRRALADLGFALIVVRAARGCALSADDADPGDDLVPLAVVWDDDEAVVRRRVCQAIAQIQGHKQGAEDARLSALSKAG
jgi:hypothetical protein